MKNQKINRGTTSDYIYETIKQRILDGDYAALTKLGEVKISQEFEVSPTPVREAFRRLVAEGFLREKPYKGVFVGEYSRREIKEALLLSAEIMSLFMRLAMEKSSEQAWQDLLQELKINIRKKQTDDAFFFGNRIFFEKIVALADSDVVLQSFRAILPIVSPELFVKKEDKLDAKLIRTLYKQLYINLELKDGEAIRGTSIKIIRYIIKVRGLGDA